jgi:hypothetical protein
MDKPLENIPIMNIGVDAAALGINAVVASTDDVNSGIGIQRAYPSWKTIKFL